MCVSECMCICVRAYIHVYVCVCVHVFMCMNVGKHTHAMLHCFRGQRTTLGVRLSSQSPWDSVSLLLSALSTRLADHEFLRILCLLLPSCSRSAWITTTYLAFCEYWGFKLKSLVLCNKRFTLNTIFLALISSITWHIFISLIFLNKILNAAH